MNTKINKNKIKVSTVVEPELKLNFEKKAKQDNLDVSTALRILMNSYSNGNLNIGAFSSSIVELPMVSELAENTIKEGIDDLKAGRYETLKSDRDIDKYLEELSN